MSSGCGVDNNKVVKVDNKAYTVFTKFLGGIVCLS